MNYSSSSSNDSNSDNDYFEFGISGLVDGAYYDYDWFIKFIPSILIYSVTFILGFVGNLLVILAICYLKKLKSITNLFLLSLATADFLLITICVPIKVNYLSKQ
jgi:hypothetical protein